MPEFFFIVINSCKIFIQVSGNKKNPAIVFIHGASISSEFWEEQLSDKKLTDNFSLYVFDLPGHGQSEKANEPEKNYTLKGLGKIVAELISALFLKEYIIAALSIAGNLIGECVEDLKGCKGILMVGPSLLGEGFPVSSLIIEHPYLHLLTAEKATNKELEGYASHVMYLPSEKHVSMFVSEYKKADTAFRTRLGNVLAEGDYSDEVENLKKSKIPLALVYGKEEASVKPQYLKEAGFHLWENKIHLIEGAGHLANIENAEMFNKLLYSFAKESLK